MMFRKCTVLFLFWILCSGFSLSPETWINDFAKLTKPKVSKNNPIRFWDHYQQNYRGFRVLYYTVPLERVNRDLDRRLHNKMVQQLSSMCQEVLTLDSFDNPTQKVLVENTLIDMVDQWKLRGTIDPASLFQRLPFIDVDLLILMERTRYEQFWDKDAKALLIGVNLAAFELDFGQPLYLDRVLTEIPWTGESASYEKAEVTALQKVAALLGERLNKAATIINTNHENDLLAAQMAEEQASKEANEQEKEEYKNNRDFIKHIEQFLKTNKEPAEFIALLKSDLDDFKQYVPTQYKKLTPDEIAQREALRDIITNRLQQYQLWLEDKIRRQNDQIVTPAQPAQTERTFAPPVDQPIIQQPSPANTQSQATADPLPASDQVPLPTTVLSGNIFDRRWIVPEGWSPSPSSMQLMQTDPSADTRVRPFLNETPSVPRGAANPSTNRLFPWASPEQSKTRPLVPKEFIQRMQINAQPAENNLRATTPSTTQPGTLPTGEAAPAVPETSTLDPELNPNLPPPIRVTNP
jgi:hypothetical protein